MSYSAPVRKTIIPIGIQEKITTIDSVEILDLVRLSDKILAENYEFVGDLLKNTYSLNLSIDPIIVKEEQISGELRDIGLDSGLRILEAHYIYSIRLLIDKEALMRKEDIILNIRDSIKYEDFKVFYDGDSQLDSDEILKDYRDKIDEIVMLDTTVKSLIDDFKKSRDITMKNIIEPLVLEAYIRFQAKEKDKVVEMNTEKVNNIYEERQRQQAVERLIIRNYL